MLLKRGYAVLIGVIALVTLFSAGSSLGSSEESLKWGQLGRLLIYYFDAGRPPSLRGLTHEQQLGEALKLADSASGVEKADAFLRKTLANYERGTLAMQGRIPLDTNPQCILGLYFGVKVPNTQLGAWGDRQFARALEQAWLVGTGKVDSWQDRLREELLSLDKDPEHAFQSGTFSLAELPYLYIYLIRTSLSEDVQRRARECLAGCLSRGYGLEPSLRQYLILMRQGALDDVTVSLEVAKRLELVGSSHRAAEVYWQVLRGTDSGDKARDAAERLARLLISQSKLIEAKTALDALSQRFAGIECSAGDIRGFLKDFPARREETSQQIVSRLAALGSEPQILPLCRLFNGLWTPQEAIERWQKVAEKAEPGSLVEQIGRVYVAEAMLHASDLDGADAAIRGLTQARSPVAQARGIMVAAEIAQRKNDWKRCVELYLKAAQIERPTTLPKWFKELAPISLWTAGTPELQLQAETSLLNAYNELTDGDYSAALDCLCQARSRPLSDSQSRVLLPMMMLAYVAVGDSVEAELWGYRTLEQYHQSHSGNEVEGLLARMQDADIAVSQLAPKIRGQASLSVIRPVIQNRAIRVIEAMSNLDSAMANDQGPGGDLLRLHLSIKRRQVASVLTAEFRFARQRLIANDSADQVPALEPFLFAAQVVGREPFDQIRNHLYAETSGDSETANRMRGFAQFAQEINTPELAKSALDAIVSDQKLGANLEALGNTAEAYLSLGSHQKAVEVYGRIVGTSADPNKAQMAKLKIIDIYTEDLKDYATAIRECEDFLKRYSDASQASQVEFLMGRLAYLNKDYGGAVGQLDGFQKKYPRDSRVGQAMLLAALGRVAEGKTDEAITRLQEIVRKYPDGDLAARSKFLIGYAQMSGQRYAAALETFKQLIEQFPKSQYAAQAKGLVDRLNKVSQ